MKCIIFSFVFVIFTLLTVSEARSRAKRFAGFGTISTVGGRVGCVVSENGPGNYSLYINSRFSKYLNENEQEELVNYKRDLAEFKDEIKTYLEERQKQALALSKDRGARGFFGATGVRQHDQVIDSTAEGQKNAGTTVTPGAKQPEPPKKPSFCSEKAVTQYVFDGCSVQGDSVYIGENFVRKLTPNEQEELEQFDKQFTAYQKAVASTFRQQVEEIFGKHFGGLFESGTGHKSNEISNESAKQRSGSTAAPQPDAPKTPDFCTLIV